jgi:hypothetical protein
VAGRNPDGAGLDDRLRSNASRSVLAAYIKMMNPVTVV